MSTNSIKTYVITSEADRIEAVEYIEEKMRKAFRCEPPETKGIICVARDENGILASLVIQGTLLERSFPLEDHYDFDLNHTLFPFYRPHIIQATRWTSSHRLASLMVIRDCAVLAQHAGKTHMLMEAKPHAVERIREIGMYCEEILGTRLNIEKARMQVGDLGMEYYLSEPTPKLYLLPVDRMISACSAQITRASG